MVTLVERMLVLHRQRQAARTPQEQTVLAAQIEATDRQIDRLVYGLYGLTVASASIFARSFDTEAQKCRSAQRRSGSSVECLERGRRIGRPQAQC